MRLTKYFIEQGSIDNEINAWVREAPQERYILQIVSVDKGVLILYENFPKQKAGSERRAKRKVKKTSKGVSIID
jgi:hypothetical protein